MPSAHQRAGSGHSGRVDISPAGPPAARPAARGPPAARQHPGRPAPPWRTAAFVAAVVGVVVLTLVLAAAARNRDSGPGDTRAVSVTADSVHTVDLQGPPGQLIIEAARTSLVTLSGPVSWTGHSAVIVTRPRVASGVLHLSYRCGAHSPCTGRLRLVVPQRCGIALRMTSGHVIVTGLAGPLSVSARSVDISATRLRTPTLAATITSGHLSAWFTGAPRRVDLTLLSAQATLHLPGRVAYRVSPQVTSGYVHTGIPQASQAGRTITARIDSGELELLER